MSVILCHASSSENGDAGWNGKAKVGDQTGKEVCTRSYYSKDWEVMLRYNNPLISCEAAMIAKKLASSNLVGYDQSNRNSLYQALKKYNWNVDEYIKSGTKTETDCSAFVYACYCCLIPSMRSDANAPTTTNMKDRYVKNGFVAYSGDRYLKTDENLIIGDLLVKSGSHTVMAITSGSKNTESVIINNTSNPITSIPISELPKYTKIQFIKDIQSAIGAKVDGIVGNETMGKLVTVSQKINRKSPVVQPLQRYLNSIGYDCGVSDGIFGKKTEKAVVNWLIDKELFNMEVDSYVWQELFRL